MMRRLLHTVLLLSLGHLPHLDPGIPKAERNLRDGGQRAYAKGPRARRCGPRARSHK